VRTLKWRRRIHKGNQHTEVIRSFVFAWHKLIDYMFVPIYFLFPTIQILFWSHVDLFVFSYLFKNIYIVNPCLFKSSRNMVPKEQSWRVRIMRKLGVSRAIVFLKIFDFNPFICKIIVIINTIFMREKPSVQCFPRFFLNLPTSWLQKQNALSV